MWAGPRFLPRLDLGFEVAVRTRERLILDSGRIELGLEPLVCGLCLLNPLELRSQPLLDLGGGGPVGGIVELDLLGLSLDLSDARPRLGGLGVAF